MNMIAGGIFASSDGHVPSWAQENPDIEIPTANLGNDFRAAASGPQASPDHGMSGPGGMG